MKNSDLQHLLEDDQRKLDFLCEVLQEERKALELRDLEQLGELLKKKQTILSSIEFNDTQRRSLLLQAGVPAGQSSIVQLKKLLQNSTDVQALALLESIEIRLQQCRELSEINNVIVHRSKLNTEKALSILRGSDAMATLYNSHGSTQSGSVKRDLGNA